MNCRWWRWFPLRAAQATPSRPAGPPRAPNEQVRCAPKPFGAGRHGRWSAARSAQPAACSAAVAPPPAAAECAQEGRTRAQQEAEIVPITLLRQIIKGKAAPTAEGMNDEHNPRRETVPEAPEPVLPPHRSDPLRGTLRQRMTGSYHRLSGRARQEPLRFQLRRSSAGPGWPLPLLAAACHSLRFVVERRITKSPGAVDPLAPGSLRWPNEAA